MPRVRKTVCLGLFVPAVLFFSACTGLSAGSGPELSSRTQPAVSPPSPPGEVLNESPVFTVSGFWNTSPSPEFLFFIGASAIRSKREESVQLALEDAARKVAMYHSLQGRYESRVETGSGLFEYRSDTVSSLTYDEDYLKYTEDLVYDSAGDVLQWENSLFIRARYPRSGETGPPFVPARLSAEGPPVWVNTPPGGVPGYVYGVGVADRRVYHRDTVNASCEAAVFSIIRNLSGRVGSGVVDAQKSGAFGYSGAVETSISSALSIQGFYVLDVWIDPFSRAVWTLALARDPAPEVLDQPRIIENAGEFEYKDEQDSQEEIIDE